MRSHNVDGRVSIVLATLNGSTRYIDQALRSLVAQTYEDIEIVVVDGGSSDGTLDIVEDILGPSGRKYMVYHTNGPEAQAPISLLWPHLVGAGNSTGEFLTFHADDDCSHPDRIRLLVEDIGDAPMAYSRLVNVNEGLHPIGESGSDLNNALYDAVVNRTEETWAPHVCLQLGMCRKELYFSERCYILGMACWEVVHTILMYGIGDLVYVPESVMFYRNWRGQTTMLGAATEDLRVASGYSDDDLTYGKYNYGLTADMRSQMDAPTWDEVMRVVTTDAKRIARRRFIEEDTT